MSKIKNFSRTEFVTVNMAKDWLNSIKDMLGLEPKSYSKVVNDKMKELFDSLEKEGDIIWFRQNIDRTFQKTIQITIYGQIKVKE